METFLSPSLEPICLNQKGLRRGNFMDDTDLTDFFLSAIVCPWLDFGLSPRCPQVCGVIEARLSHFLPRWLRTGWPSAISRGWELNPGHGQDRQ